MPCRLLVYVFWIIKIYTCGKKRCTILKAYGQLVLLPARTESTRTFSLVNLYFFCNSYFGQLVLFLWSTRTFFFVQLVLLKKITYGMLCFFIMAII